jgi:hypothetical protein
VPTIRNQPTQLQGNWPAVAPSPVLGRRHPNRLSRVDSGPPRSPRNGEARPFSEGRPSPHKFQYPQGRTAALTLAPSAFHRLRCRSSGVHRRVVTASYLFAPDTMNAVNPAKNRPAASASCKSRHHLSVSEALSTPARCARVKCPPIRRPRNSNPMRI